jgi:diketogulonate reductase-like aldo/keto reductase
MIMKPAKNLSTKEIENYIMEYEKHWKTPEGSEDKKTFDEIHEILIKNGCLNNKQLYQVARWKTQRVSKIVKNNPDDIVKNITAFALKVSDEKYKIRILCNLYGIGVPRASAILTMYNPETYGVIDVNAWYALTGKERLGFNSEDWIWYLGQIKELAKKHNKTPRQIDMALMIYGQKLRNKIIS